MFNMEPQTLGELIELVGKLGLLMAAFYVGIYLMMIAFERFTRKSNDKH